MLEAFHWWRATVPTARRVIAAHVSSFRDDAERLRGGMAKGKYDAYLLMPRGARDEEFHTAICELLSDWGSTVAEPEVVAVAIVSPVEDALTLSIRDYLDRMGMPNRVYAPDSDKGRAVLEHVEGDVAPEYPLVMDLGKRVATARSRARRRHPHLRPAGRRRRGPRRRRRHRGCRTGGPRGRRLRLVRRAVDGRPRGGSRWRTGGHVVDDPQLPRLPEGDLGYAAGPAGAQPGGPLRHRVLHRLAGHVVHAGTAGTAARWRGGRAGPHVLHTEGGDVRARAVVVSAGVKYRRLDAPGIERLVGLGVHYGSAMTAAREMEGADVMVVGGGNSAGQAAIHLARFARSVTILVRRESLAETMSSYLVGEIGYNPRITVQGCSEVTEGGAGEDGRLGWVTVRDTAGGTEERRDCRGLFLLIGAAPYCDWLPDAVARDERGFVLTGRDVPQRLWRDGLPPESLETTVPGVFAAGDIRAGSMKRVAAPAGRARRSCRSCTPGSTRPAELAGPRSQHSLGSVRARQRRMSCPSRNE